LLLILDAKCEEKNFMVLQWCLFLFWKQLRVKNELFYYIYFIETVMDAHLATPRQIKNNETKLLWLILYSLFN